MVDRRKALTTIVIFFETFFGEFITVPTASKIAQTIWKAPPPVQKLIELEGDTLKKKKELTALYIKYKKMLEEIKTGKRNISREEFIKKTNEALRKDKEYLESREQLLDWYNRDDVYKEVKAYENKIVKKVQPIKWLLYFGLITATVGIGSGKINRQSIKSAFYRFKEEKKLSSQDDSSQ